MNRTKIEWTDFTWNPITGCTRGCPYCYARVMANRLRGRCGYPKDEPFKPTFHRDRLLEPYRVKKPSKIFTVSMGDMFGNGVLREWVHRVMRVIWDCSPHSTLPEHPVHQFQILTKCPYAVHTFFPNGYTFPPNVWLGVTVENQRVDWRITALRQIKIKGDWIRFVSFEPLHGEINVNLWGIDWVIIGAETGNRKDKITPRKEWITKLLDAADEYGIPVFMKDNLRPYWSGEWRQEFPEVVE